MSKVEVVVGANVGVRNGTGQMLARKKRWRLMSWILKLEPGPEQL
jgi:hypothetical protein